MSVRFWPGTHNNNAFLAVLLCVAEQANFFACEPESNGGMMFHKLVEQMSRCLDKAE